MKQLLVFMLLLLASQLVAGPKKKMVAITVAPKEASIFVNNQFINYGFAKFQRPKKQEMVAIRIECEGYNPIETKFYGSDIRNALSFTMQEDGFYRTTAASGLVNKFMTIDIDSTLYVKNANGKVDVSKAWKLLHQILLNYFEEIATTDVHGGYLQTPWHYKAFQLSNKQIRTRVTMRDISNPDKIAFQIKVSSEVAGAMASRHGEFTNIDRIVKEFEPMLQELQTRLGKAYSL